MEELAKAVQKKYVEDITKKYPLHRFLVLFLFLLSAYIYSTGTDIRIVQSIQDVKLNFVFDFKKGLLSSVTFENLFVCIFATGSVSYLYSQFSSKFFNLFSKSSNFDSYIKTIEEKVSSKKSDQEMLNYFLAKDISKQLDDLRVKIKSNHIRSEICFGIIFCMLYGVSDFIAFDWAIIIGLVFYVLLNSWVSFRFYISDFLPYYITEQTLLGSKTSFGDK
jgi:hypothetical protein